MKTALQYVCLAFTILSDTMLHLSLLYERYAAYYHSSPSLSSSNVWLKWNARFARTFLKREEAGIVRLQVGRRHLQ